jgi:aryl-alcohol dehydrogenase-like predicted oxidoreductase
VRARDVTTSLEETLSALTDLVRQGKVRHIGVSNFTGWKLREEQAAKLSEASAIEEVYPYRFVREMQRV